LSEEKNFLQSIKLEISRNLKLNPYERVAFHNILGLLKSEQGKNLLIKEIEKGGDIASSAIRVLAEFDDPSVIPLMLELMAKNLPAWEKEIILDFIEKRGGPEQVQPVIDFLEKHRVVQGNDLLIRKAFHTLKKIGSNSPDTGPYIMSIIEGDDKEGILAGAINVLPVLKKVEVYEELLKRNIDSVSCSVFQSIYDLNRTIYSESDESFNESELKEQLVEKRMTEDEELVLNIKVLLGKMTSRFDDYSIKTRTAFINAMLSCNHRESVIYCMKALESKEPDLRRMVLYSISSNITTLRFPEKLFRSMISMNVENDRDNELIAQVFAVYFNRKDKGRSLNLFRDKMYGYITATLESFFETYRREFMIPEVIEQAFPENFRKVRTYILKNMTPEQKRRLLSGFANEGKDFAGRMIPVMAEWISYVDKDETDQLSALIDLMIDDDRVSRDNSIARLESINFEKKYLQLRIIRLCEIIHVLEIESAAKSLVYIYNYLKKYPDPELYEAAVFALSRINYSYMLSEVEIMLTAGSPEEQEKSILLLPLFTEKRVINILTDYLKNNFASSGAIVTGITRILVDQNIKSNVNAAAIFKQLIENNKDNNIRLLAISGLGRCAYTEDIDYLHELFLVSREQSIKEAIVRAICSIMAVRNDYSKQQLSRQVQEYLKDPGIKVRIFSCMILIRLGNKDAFRSVREMLIIKNKSIQREILTVLRDIHTPDFNFFLLSLLREEYGISRDIIDIMKKLPDEELKEIETFIVNIFRKYEIPQPATGMLQKESVHFTGVAEKTVSVLSVEIVNAEALAADLNYYELIELYMLCDLLIIPGLKGSSGSISHKESNRVTICYEDSLEAMNAAISIRNNVIQHNRTNVISRNIVSTIEITTGKFSIAGDELVNPRYLLRPDRMMIPVMGQIIIDSATERVLKNRFYSIQLPEALLSEIIFDSVHYEYISPVNFTEVTTSMLNAKEEEIEKRKEMQAQIEAQVKTVSAANRSTTSIAIAGELENIGIKLKNQFDEIEKYMNRRSTDRELNRNIKVMLTNVYNIYRVEISKLTIK